MEGIPDDDNLSEDEDDDHFNTAVSMEVLDYKQRLYLIWFGHQPIFKVKRKGNNVKLTKEQSHYLNEFVEKHLLALWKTLQNLFLKLFMAQQLTKLLYRLKI